MGIGRPLGGIGSRASPAIGQAGPMTDRDYDIVLFGATGFTGGLTAEYLARHAPARLRWALAGRSLPKLEAVRRRLAGIDPRLEDMDLLVADAADRGALDAVVGRARVAVTTVGPYLEYGGPLVAACAAAGTDYVDLTGEPEFVDRMYLDHHATAVETGARLVHACGFDSIPYDLGVYFTMKHVTADRPVRVRGVVRSNAAFSGGTFHSALGAMSRLRQAKAAYAARRKAEGRPEGRSSRAVPGKPHHDSELGWWLLPLPTIDPVIVARSGAALASYGPEFRYSHYVGVTKLTSAAGLGLGAGGLVLAAQVPPLRELLKKRVPQGEGPDESRRRKSWFTVDFVAEAGDQVVRSRVSGGDPGYTDTAKMLAESALCLAFDSNPETSGQVTTAVAMGDHLLTRLTGAGLKFDLL
jgi:saccharopine dehydrogenase (NAD+, L-glutamate forming)